MTATVSPVVSAPSLPKWQVWTGRGITALLVLFFLFDSTMKLLKVQAVMEGTMRYGYSANAVFPIGVVLLLCTALYVVPRTSFVGAILLTGYLGGATATHVRVGEPFIFPVAFGVLVWVGLCLRRARLRPLVFSAD